MLYISVNLYTYMSYNARTQHMNKYSLIPERTSLIEASYFLPALRSDPDVIVFSTLSCLFKLCEEYNGFTYMFIRKQFVQ